MKTKKQSYVTFFSPGTFIAEMSTRPVDSWDTKTAVGMAETITERYGARPYGFRFHDRLEHEPIPDGHGGEFKVEPKKGDESGMFYIDGIVKTFDEVPADDAHDICRSNMRCNGYSHIVEVKRGYLSTREFTEEDAVVDATGAVTLTGKDAGISAYRDEFMKRRQRYYDEHLKEMP